MGVRAGLIRDARKDFWGRWAGIDFRNQPLQKKGREMISLAPF
jgi:hypothetical protein